MDIVNFWKQQVDIWKEEERCGFCWEFDAPLTDASVNYSQNDLRCCTYLYLTDIEQSYVPKYSESTGLKTNEQENITFSLYVVRRGDLSTNNYQEMKDYPVSESNWVKIYEPLKECVSKDYILDFCKILGLKIDITQWKMTLVNKEFDNNYIGWKIRANFRQEL